MQEGRAHKNWAKLRDLFAKKRLLNQQKTRKYNLIPYESTTCLQQNKTETVYSIGECRLKQFTPTFSSKQMFSYSQSSAIDTTGNWVWEAEEVAAYFIAAQQHYFIYQQQISVLELGAGTSGLAGIALASLGNRMGADIRLTLSDGRVENISYLRMNIESNMLQHATAEHLEWGRIKGDRKFDLIIACDCLFFREFHLELIHTLQSCMHSASRAIFVNPKRGQSMRLFLSLLGQNGLTSRELKFEDSQFVRQEREVQTSTHFREDEDHFYFLEVRNISKLILELNEENDG